MDVNFLTSAGKTFTIEVGFFDTVLEIKEKIEKYEGYPIASQKLIFNGQCLLDDRDTQHYEILQGSIIHLVTAEPELGHQTTPPPPSSSPATHTRSKTLKLSVLSMNGGMTTLVETDERSKVVLLREELRKSYAMINFNLPDEYFFIHNREVMNEDYSFHQHNVKDGDIVEVFLGKVSREQP